MKHFTLAEFHCPCGHCDGGTITEELQRAADAIREWWGRPLIVNSGFRCAEHNKAVGGAPGSAHCTGEAVDFKDPDGALDAWIGPQLERFGVWREAPFKTPGWLHVQVRPAHARTFNP